MTLILFIYFIGVFFAFMHAFLDFTDVLFCIIFSILWPVFFIIGFVYALVEFFKENK